MKLIYFLVIFACFINALAQRRLTRPETSTTEKTPRLTSRGRTKFSATTDFSQAAQEIKSETDHRRAPRRRINTRPHTTPLSLLSNANNYEVSEAVDEAPFETPRRFGKSRTISETRFEAANAPKKSLFDPAPTTPEPSPDELFKSFGSSLTNDISTNPAESETLPITAPLSSTSSATSPSTDVSDEPGETQASSSAEPVVKPSTDSISSDTPKIEHDFKREHTRPVTRPAKSTEAPTETRKEPNRRRTLRTRVNARNHDSSESSSREQPRVRTRVQRVRVEDTHAASSNTVPRATARLSRRRGEIPVAISTEAPDTIKARTPSVLTAEEPQPYATRSRTGRKIGTAPTPTRKRVDNTPPKVTLDLSESQKSVRRTPARRNPQNEATTTSKPSPRSVERSSRRRSSRFSSRTAPIDPLTEASLTSRSRSRTLDFPLDIDESKLEVLPLFEREDKIISTNKLTRRRSFNSNEEAVEMSATEHDEKVALEPAKKDSIVSSPLNKAKTSQRKSFGVEHTTAPSFKPKKDFKRPPKQQIRESVVSKVTQVTSRRTVGRRRLPGRTSTVTSSEENVKVKVEEPKVSVSQVITTGRITKPRKNFGNFKRNPGNKIDLTKSEEEIDDTDNYPEEFKARLQAKMTKQVSRTESPNSVRDAATEAVAVKTTTTQKPPTIVTSSPSSPSSVVTLVSIITGNSHKEIDEQENELEPKVHPSGHNRPTRRRVTTTKKPAHTEKPKRTFTTKKTITSRSTTPHTPHVTKKDHRFHARFTASPKVDHEATTPSSSSKHSYSAKPRGLYSSSRRSKDGEKHFGRSNKQHHENSVTQSKVPANSAIVHKSNRFSSRYRSDLSGRGVSIRSTTSTPAYVPTIPTVTPSTSIKPGVAIEDKDLGLEVIMFDDPVNTIPSADLVNGEYLSSTARNHFILTATSPSISTSTTGKAVSIIESIINSITAINSTADENLTKKTTPGFEPASGSAILKLATKKTDKSNTDDDTDKTTRPPQHVSTSEKPTTIIQKILTSLSAIQADDTNEKKVASKQVGTNYNTISTEHTSPLPRVTKSTGRNTLPARISTPVNPLSVLDEISEEQVLQKRTIGKLLALLNSLTTHNPANLVVVTPKIPSTFGGFVNSAPSASKSVVNTSSTVDTTATTLVQTTPVTTQSMPVQSTPPPFISKEENDENAILSRPITTTTSTTTNAAETTTVASTTATTPVATSAQTSTSAPSTTIAQGETSSPTTSATTATDETTKAVITPTVNDAAETIFTTPPVTNLQNRMGTSENITQDSNTPPPMQAATPIMSNSTTLDITNGAEIIPLFVNENVTRSLVATTPLPSVATTTNGTMIQNVALPAVVTEAASTPNSSPAPMTEITTTQAPPPPLMTTDATTNTSPPNKNASSNTISQSPASLTDSPAPPPSATMQSLVTTGDAVATTPAPMTEITTTQAPLPPLMTDESTTNTPPANKDASSNTISQSPSSLTDSPAPPPSTTMQSLITTGGAVSTTPMVPETSMSAAVTTASIPTTTMMNDAPQKLQQSTNEILNTTAPTNSETTLPPTQTDTVTNNPSTPPIESSGIASTSTPVQPSDQSTKFSSRIGEPVATTTLPTPTANIKSSGTLAPPLNIKDFLKSLTSIVFNGGTTQISPFDYTTPTPTETTESTDTIFTYPSTLPAFINFEVSPGSVSIFSANDLSNAITVDDNIGTVTISSRTKVPDSSTTTESTTTTNTKSSNTPEVSTSVADVNNAIEVTANVADVNITTDINTSGAGVNNITQVNTSDAGVNNTTDVNTSVADVNNTTINISSRLTDASNDTVQADVAAPVTSAPVTATTQAVTPAATTSDPKSGDPQATTLSAAPSTNPPLMSTQSDSPATTTMATSTMQASAQSTASPVTTSAPTTAPPTLMTTAAVVQMTSMQPTALMADAQSTAAPSATSTAANAIASTDSMAAFTSPPLVSNTTVSASNTSVNNLNMTQSSATTPSPTMADRTGRLLAISPDPVQNSIESSSTPDYFIFAVLNNNTILRKRPPTIPSKETPYLIVGVYPNNTIVKKFPNGTEVPMEPIIRVRGFDTRENPPPLPDITSNQVTPDQGSPPDNTNLQMVDSTSNTISPNPLSVSSTTVSSTSSTTTTPNPVDNTIDGSTSSTTAKGPDPVQSTVPPASGTTMAGSSTTVGSAEITTSVPSPSSTTAQPAAIPSLTEILNGKTVQAFNNLLNRTDNVETLEVDTKSATPGAETKASLENRIGPSATNAPAPSPAPTTPTPTAAPTTPAPTPAPTTPAVTAATTVPTAPPATTQAPTTPAPTTTTTTPTTTTTTPPPTTTAPPTTTTTTQPPTTTTPATTTTTSQPPTRPPTTTQPPATATIRLTTPAVTERYTQTPVPATAAAPYIPTLRTNPPLFQSTTFFPIFSTILSSLQPAFTSPLPPVTKAPVRRISSTKLPPTTTRFTTTPTTTTQPPSTTIAKKAAPLRPESIFDILSRSTAGGVIDFNAITGASTTVSPVTTTFASPTTVTRRSTTREAVTVTPTKSSRSSTTKRSANGKKELTEEQKENLRILAELEREQASILQQLSFLTNLQNLGAQKKTPTDKNNLANRIIAIAMERDKEKTTPPPASQQGTPTLEEILKRYNLEGLETVTPASNLPTTYGTSGDAILAALLKQHGIEPTTPKGLGDQLKETEITTEPKPKKKVTKRPRTTTTTTLPPGRLRQGLAWLLNAFAPPTATTTRKPKARPRKPKAKKPVTTTPPSDELELLSNQPTHITPVVQAMPAKQQQLINSLSQDDIQKLIKQLEAIQSNSNIDASSLKSLQGLLSGNEGVQVMPSGMTGTTTRLMTTQPPEATTTLTATRAAGNIIGNSGKPTTSTVKPKLSLPPVSLKPIAGIDSEDTEPVVRGQLITSAINVTRAISQFLGSALQGAAHSFQSIIGSGSRMVGTVARGSSSSQPN